MSQQFQADAVSFVGAVTLPNGAQTQVLLGNFVTPPYGNCKIRVRCSCTVLLGTIPTNIKAQIIRNPTGDNTGVTDTATITAGVAANLAMQVICDGVDLVPDGRPCQYALQVLGNGTGTNDSATRAYIEATILSG